MIPLRDATPSRTPPVTTGALIVLNLAAFWLELMQPPERLEAGLAAWGLVAARISLSAAAAHPARVLAPWVTHMFLHAGWIHVLGNLWFLWLFGDNVEDRMGHGRFLAFYLLCGFAAAGTQVALHPRALAPLIGASGAIAGVMGAYFWLYPRARVLTFVPFFIFFRLMELPAWFVLGWWFLLQFLVGTASLAGAGDGAGVAFWAHVGGFLAGLLLLRPFVRRRSVRSR